MATLCTRTGWRNALVAGVCAILALLPFAQGGTTDSSDPNTKLTTVLADLARSVRQDRPPFLEERSGAGARLSLDALPASVRDAMQSRHLRINARNEVQVYILVDEVNDANLQELKANGVIIEITDAAHRRVQARIPVRRFHAVAELPFVNFVRLPTYAVRHAGSVTTEGDGILRASVARQQFGLDGTGIRVGVISDGLKGVFTTGCTTCGGVANGPMATGDLPSATGTRNSTGVLISSSGGIVGRSFIQTSDAKTNNDLEGLPPAGCAFKGAGAEGTALLEIVHDIAPGAQLSFANADTDMAFQQAVNYLASTNDIVADDLGFYGDAYDGTSGISTNTANALNNPANRIRTYVTSNGNAADEHYIGTYAASSTDGASISGVTSSGHLHQFSAGGDTVDVLGKGAQPYNKILLPPNGEVVIFLGWDDPFGASSNNYDLYLVRDSTGTAVAFSNDPQDGKKDPLEFIDYVNRVTPVTAPPEYFSIVIQNVKDAAQPKELNLFSFQPQCAVDGPRLLAPPRHERHSYNTATRSVAAQSDAGGSPVSVISVGAICSASAAAQAVFSGSPAPDESCFDAGNSTIEFFSSQGPTLDGRTKPDVSAIDGVSITGAGQFPSVTRTPFFGTSAASPHVAGIAALLLQAAPCLVSGAPGAIDTVTARTALRNLIVGNAVPLGGTVPDNVFGSGRVDALNSVEKALPVLSGPAVTVAGNAPNGASLTAAQLGFADPNQCALTRVTASGGCSGSGATITCPFGTTTASVSASNNGVSFSPPSNLQVTVTNFGVAAAPGTATVTAGQSATYQVTVSPQGGPFASPVTLACANLPPQAACSFSPATVTPGTGSARATVTISTTARSSFRSAAAGRALGPLTPSSRRVPGLLVALAAILTIALARRKAPGGHRRASTGGWLALRPILAAMFPLVALVLALIIGPAACGGGSQTPPTPSVTVSPTNLTFATQNIETTSAAQTVTLTNGGKAALTITSIAASGDFAQTNTCGSSVGAGASCSIAVTFRPTAAGQRTGAVTIQDNAAGSPHTVSLTGTGLAGGTPPGSYQVGITGSSGTLVQSGTVTLVVQ